MLFLKQYSLSVSTNLYLRRRF